MSDVCLLQLKGGGGVMAEEPGLDLHHLHLVILPEGQSASLMVDLRQQAPK